MPDGTYQVIVHQPILKVWGFVKDMDNWAPLVPGYIAHEKLNARQSTWEFYQDIGIIKKKIQLLVTIREWKEPEQVTFDLKGINEKFKGSGYFKAEEAGQNKTKMTGYLNIEAEGPMGKIINKVLKKSMPKTAEEITAAIAAKFK